MADASVLVVGCGFPQLGLVKAARALGLRVVGADQSKTAVAVAHCDAFELASTADPDAIVAAARRAKVDGVVTCGSELALRTSALAAERLAVPFYASPATVDRCQAKDLMRAAYERGGAPSPAFVGARACTEARAFVATHGLPVIVKPARGWGQRGVAKVEHEAELAPAFDRALSVNDVVVVERFVEGREFSVNAYTREGRTEVLAVTERIISAYPDPPGITFAEWHPSGLDAEQERLVIDAAVRGASALGIERGPSYTQVRFGSSGAALVETAHRLGGGLDPEVTLLASGVSLYRRILGVALGRPDWEASGPESARHGGVIGKFLVGRPGRIRAVSGLAAARAATGVVSAELYVGVGATVHPLVDGSKRIGHVLAVGTTREEADQRARCAADLVRVETEPL